MGGEGGILRYGTQPGSEAVNGLQSSTRCVRCWCLLNSRHILVVRSVQERQARGQDGAFRRLLGLQYSQRHIRCVRMLRLVQLLPALQVNTKPSRYSQIQVSTESSPRHVTQKTARETNAIGQISKLFETSARDKLRTFS